MSSLVMNYLRVALGLLTLAMLWSLISLPWHRWIILQNNMRSDLQKPTSNRLKLSSRMFSYPRCGLTGLCGGGHLMANIRHHQQYVFSSSGPRSCWEQRYYGRLRRQAKSDSSSGCVCTGDFGLRNGVAGMGCRTLMPARSVTRMQKR